jgi:hypothetical protein
MDRRRRKIRPIGSRTDAFDARRPGRADLRWQDERVQRVALGILFAVIAVSLGAVAVWAALAGGRAWVVALAAGALALWMGDLARRVVPSRRE